MRCFIFAAGDFDGLAERPAPGDLILAADAGYRNCRAAGLRPDLVVGDFDSMDAPEDETLLRLPVEKDDTDTLRAARLGLERGCRDFVLCGGTGGRRADHTLANLQTLVFLASRGAEARMTAPGCVWRTLKNARLDFPAGMRGTLSVFCPDGEARGVTIRGTKYELENGVLRSDFPLGVSNSFTGGAAYVSVAEGTLLLYYETQDRMP